MTSPEPKPTSGQRVRRFLRTHPVAWVSGSVVLVLVGAGMAYGFGYAPRFLPRTYVSGVSIGGLTMSQAEAKLEDVVSQFTGTSLQLEYQGQTWKITPNELGSNFDISGALASVWDHQKNGGRKHELIQLAEAPFVPLREDLGFSVFSDAGKQHFADTVLRKVEVPYRETSIAIDAKAMTVVPGKAGQQLDHPAFEAAFYRNFKDGNQPITLATIPFQPQLTAAQVEPLRQQISDMLSAPWSVNLGATTVSLDPATIASWFTTKPSVDATGVVTGLQLLFKPGSLDSLLATWHTQVDQPAHNAQLGVTNGEVSVVADGSGGRALDSTATQVNLIGAMVAFTAGQSRVVQAVVNDAQPAVSAANYQSLGLTHLVGTGTTDFSGSPVNRVANITLGAKDLNGTLVMPGETYSTIGNLGPIDNAHGFLNELVIKDNRTVPDAGGGLCQVSTTLFRAVLNAGLPIVQRQNHSYRVSYYERGTGPGLDATIYDPQPDFRWKNNFTTPVFIQSSVKGNTITFNLFGTSDGRVSTISAPTILSETPPGDPIYSTTDTLYVGQTQQIEHPHSGAKTVVTYTVARDGKTIDTETFKSDYQPWPAQYLVGSKPLPVTPDAPAAQ